VKLLLCRARRAGERVWHFLKPATLLLASTVAIAQTTVPVSGHVLIPDGSAPGSTSIRFELIGCPNGQARVDGVAILGDYKKDFAVNSTTGAFSGALYPNTLIDCQGTLNTTQYNVTVLVNGRPNGKTVPYVVGPGAFVLESAAAATTSPAIVTPNAVVTNPTGGGLQTINGPIDVTAITCLGSACGGVGGGGYNRIQNAATNLAQRTTVNFFSGIVCADNSGATRTDCQLDTSIAPTWTGAHTFNASVNLAGGFKINGAAAAGKIPIGDGANFVPGDPLVQGLFAEGSTSAQNPVAIGGFDTAGTPAIHGAKVLNSTPAGSEYGIVTRPIPSGTQPVSGIVTVQQSTAANLKVDLSGTAANTTAIKVDGSAVTQPVSGTVTANVGTTNGLALDATLTGGSTKAINRGGAKGATSAADVTSTASGANHQGLDVALYDASGNQLGLSGAPVRVDPTGTTTQPVSGTVTANAGSGTFATKQVDSGGADATDTTNHAVKVSIVSGGGTGGGPADAAANAAASESDAARQKVTSVVRLLDTGQAAGSQLVTAKGDQASGLWVNCKAGCSAAGDTSTGSTALGALNATITIALAGETGATFQLQSGGTGVYTVTPQCSFDGGTLYNVNGYIQDPVTGQLAQTATIASAQATTDYPVICPPHASNAQIKVTSYTSGTANWLARAAVNNGPFLYFAAVQSAAPSPANGTIAPISMTTAGAIRTDSSATTQPVSGTVTVQQSTAANLKVDLSGTAANATAIKIDGSAVTQPVSGTVTANVGTTNGLALDATLTGGSTKAINRGGAKGTTSAADVTSTASGANHQGLDVALYDASGNQLGVSGAPVRVDPTGTTTQPVSGTVTVQQSTAANLKVDLSGTAANTTAIKVDGSAVTQPVNVNQVAGNAVAADSNGRQIIKEYPDTGTASYHASKKFAASSTTDIAVIPGNASNTVLLTRITLTCTQTTAGQISVELIKRSTADTGGTSAGFTEVPDDSNYAAASSALLSYTGTGPTVGTAVGDLDNAQIGCMAPGTAASNDIYFFKPSKPIVLRGVAQEVAINLGGALTGGNVTVTFEWMETTTP